MGTTNVTDLFSDDNVQASMMEFGKGMQKVMVNFQNCTERIKIGRSSAISDHIRETRRLRDTFRQFVEDSLEFNERLSNYSLDILFFIKCFKDFDNYSDEVVLGLMHDLLEKSRENHELSKELKKKIKTDDESGINDRINSESKIETFWGMQTERIKYLIDNLESGRDINRQRAVHNIEQKWKNVEKECQIYNRAMNDVLTRDRLICIE
ncbi:hypothetical protein GLOIN_2v190066 [Rhizophagus irregularis DAOM 181602=DAOM 197198]|nr:hypothetical protein GLOIN_2v190066 [Rhizophagus irregularis DAOM 181602=DAOM 197198]